MLKAQSIGRPLARRLQAAAPKGAPMQVHSCFERACNLLWAGRLVGLVDPDLGNGPEAVLVTPPGGGFRGHPAWAPGTAVRLSGQQLQLATGAGVDLTGARIWEPEPPRPEGRGEPAAGARWLAGVLAETAASRGAAMAMAATGLSPPPDRYGQMASERVQRLSQALHAGDGPAAAAAAARLIGLGPGLTPAGDDLLAGLTATLLLAVRWRMAGPRAAAAAEALSTLLADGLGGQTTLPGESLLRSAARGWLAQHGAELVTGLLAGDGQGRSALPRLLATGATSGIETVAGIFLALRFLADDQVPAEEGLYGTHCTGQGERVF